MKLCTCMNSAFTLRATVPQKLSKSISRLVLSRLWLFRDTWSTQENMITSSIQVGPVQIVALEGLLKHTGTQENPCLSRLVLSSLCLFRDTWGWSCPDCGSSESLAHSGTHKESRVNPRFSCKEPQKFASIGSAFRRLHKWITTGRRGSQHRFLRVVAYESFKNLQCEIWTKTVNFEFLVSELFYFYCVPSGSRNTHGWDLTSQKQYLSHSSCNVRTLLIFQNASENY